YTTGVCHQHAPQPAQLRLKKSILLRERCPSQVWHFGLCRWWLHVYMLTGAKNDFARQHLIECIGPKRQRQLAGNYRHNEIQMTKERRRDKESVVSFLEETVGS